VNNCSSDESLAIARKYAAANPRIQIHDNSQFLRVIPNHNLALRQISPQSKYCKMIFADDWMFPECLERMVAVAEKHPSIGIVGAYGLEGRKVVWTGLPYPSPVVSGRELARGRFLGPEEYVRARLYVFGTSTSVLYRSDMVRSRQSFFNEANLHADSEVCYDLLRNWDFGFVHQVLTFLRERPGSLTSFSKQMNTNIAGSLYEVVTYGPDYLNKEEYEFALERVLSEYYDFLAGSLLFGRRDKEFWSYHRRKLNETGVGFSKVRLAKAVAAKFANAALNPKRTVEKLLLLQTDGASAQARPRQNERPSGGPLQARVDTGAPSQVRLDRGSQQCQGVVGKTDPN
jgi:glycosyltransferase involved in cell wall biosynthesis